MQIEYTFWLRTHIISKSSPALPLSRWSLFPVIPLNLTDGNRLLCKFEGSRVEVV